MKRYARVKSVTTIGLEVIEVIIEVDIDKKAVLHEIDVVGLGDTVIKESKKRVKSAMINSGFSFPQARVTINLAPSDVKKEGSYLDLPMAVGILKGSSVIKDELDDYLFFGELGLDGTVRKVRGVLPILLSLMKRKKKPTVILPHGNRSEASVLKGIEVITVKNLGELVQFLNHEISKNPVEYFEPVFQQESEEDISDIKGQEFAKRAAEIAAAGGHNILLRGSPGCGKTMLARRFPGILPRMTLEEAIETTKIYSVAGLLDGKGLVTQRPFRSPHHTASTISVIGGGTNAKPGEISLSHNGVLFLDEFPEFRRDAVEALRQPLEDGVVNISRAKITASYPSRFMLVLAQNPCPCGWYGDPSHECSCNWNDIKRYNRKISGPLEDRIDMFVDMPRLEYGDYASEKHGETSTQVRDRVEEARKIQLNKLRNHGIYSNSQLSHRQLEEVLEIDFGAKMLLESAVERLKFTGRSIDKVLKVALTIATLEGGTKVYKKHIAEAIQYRKKAINI